MPRVLFWEGLRRDRIHTKVVLDVGDALVETTYSMLAERDVVGERDMTDTADFIGERVKDNVWARIPGEQSS